MAADPVSRGSNYPHGTLVMLHGWGMHGGVFEAIHRRLEPEFTVHRLELPGHGSRPRGELLGSLDQLAKGLAQDLPPAIWLGWSLGGLIAARVAQLVPRQVTALALVAATPRFVAAEDWTCGMNASVFRSFADDLENDHRKTLERFVALEVHGSDTARRDLSAMLEVLHACPPPDQCTLRSGLALLESVDLRPTLSSLTQPVLLIGGTRDRLVPPSAVEAYADLLPNAQVAMMSGSGHAPFIGHPNGFLEHLHAFLEEHSHRDATA